MLETSPLIPTLLAADLRRATKFYTETLGLPALNAAVGTLLRAGKGTNLWLYEKGPDDVLLGSSHFIVGDIRAAMKKLRDRGVIFEDYDLPGFKTKDGVGEIGPLKVASFRDTENNLLNIFQVTGG
jgi:catechol 2,3-dioxygenase-like lactoylglutathione lyase family enzyme